MVPAQQRLDAGDLSAHHIDLRLVVQRKLVALQRAAKCGFQGQALDRLRLDLLGEETKAVLAVVLGEIHRHVGILGQCLHVAAVGRIHRDADRSRGVALVAAELQGLAQHGQQFAGDAFDLVAFGGFFQDHDEFVAPEPRHDVARTQRAPQPAADFHQQPVAGVMAQRIVDDLEPVEIDEQHRERTPIARRGVDRPTQQPVEHLTVRQIGQAVVRGKIFDSLVGPGFFVGADKILQRERHIVSEPLQQLGEFRRERILFDRDENHDTDNLSAHGQREGRAGACPIPESACMERLATLVGQVIVDDAGLARTDRHAGGPTAFRMGRIARQPHLA